MSGLKAFFMENASTKNVCEAVISDRFKDDGGKPVKWKIRAVGQEENEEIMKISTRRVKVKNSFSAELDQHEYLARLVATAVEYPNLKDTQLQQSYGVSGADKLIKKMLLAGEYMALVRKVQEWNGFDKSMAELVDEAKNS